MTQYQPPYSPLPPDQQPQWGQWGQQPQWGQLPSQPFPQQGYSQPQWQGQPQYPQQAPFQPPKKKSHKGLWIALAIIAAVVVFGCVGVVALLSAGGHAVQQAANRAATEIATTASGQPTSAPQSTQTTSQPNAIGQPVVADDTWIVTVNRVLTSSGNNFITPKSGNTFLEIIVTLKNTSSSSQTASSLLMFSLVDSTGQKYDQSLGIETSPDGPVAANALLRGTVTYEVPKSIHTFTLQFQPQITSSNIVQWTVKD